MTCTIIALVVLCSGTPIKTDPATAARILGPMSLPAPSDAVRGAKAPAGTSQTPTSLPWLRLDGSSYNDPPWIAVHYLGRGYRQHGPRTGKPGGRKR